MMMQHQVYSELFLKIFFSEILGRNKTFKAFKNSKTFSQMLMIATMTRPTGGARQSSVQDVETIRLICHTVANVYTLLLLLLLQQMF